tara:strand:+ start:5696 stop:6622 length:927 start_codon:yes stop_codon:yes gene_type:complete
MTRPISKGNPVKVLSCSGIGDLHWMLTKIESYKEKNNITHLTVDIADEDRRRGHQILEACPLVDHWSYVDIPYSKLRLGYVPEPYIPLEPNSWLEAGKRIEDWLPSYETNWQIPLNSSTYAESWAKDIEKKACGRPVLAIYSGSTKGSLICPETTWKAQDWDSLVRHLTIRVPYYVIAIGSTYDDLPVTVFDLDLRGKTEFHEVLEILNMVDAQIGFHSGLSVIANSMHTPNWMIYWAHRRIKNLPNSWPEPVTLDKIHRNSFFNESASIQSTKIRKWLEENLQFFRELKQQRREDNPVLKREGRVIT